MFHRVDELGFLMSPNSPKEPVMRLNDKEHIEDEKAETAT